MAILLTQKELAELVGKTDRTIRLIDKERPPEERLCVKDESGKYDAALFVQRWCALQVERATCDTDDLDAVKARHEIVKTEKTQLEVARMRGDLVDVQDVKRLWGNIANTIMQSMIHLPSTIAPMVRGLENVEVINNIIDTEIRRVLNGLADTPLPDYAASANDGESEE